MSVDIYLLYLITPKDKRLVGVHSSFEMAEVAMYDLQLECPPKSRLEIFGILLDDYDIDGLINHA